MFDERERVGEELERRIAATCGALNRLFGELVDEVAEALRLKLWAVDGIRTPEHWVQWRTGLSRALAIELVRIARRADDLPVCAAALREGSMSLDQLDAVARHVPAANDEDVVEIARMATVSQLNRVLAKMPFVDDTATPANPMPFEPSLRTVTDREGHFSIHACGPADEGAIVDQALAEARDALFRAGRVDATDWDALVEVANRSLGAATRRGRRDRFRVYVHLDTGGGWLTSGPRLPGPMLDGLTCDGVLRPVWETDGRPVALGRTARVVPPDVRRLVLDRDRGCRHPGCDNRRFLDIHHLVHWRDGGATDPANLIALCGLHHHAHHDGELQIAEESDGVVFRNRHGVRISGPAPRPPNGPPPTGPPCPGPTGERLAARWWTVPDRPPPSAA